MKLLDSLISAIRASAASNSGIQTPPSCILWPDAERQWQGALPLLQTLMPELLLFGAYEPQNRKGPAIWLRCALAGKIDEASIPEGLTPVIYLPGIGRRDLRAVDSCPKTLQPLAPLQYDGVFFSQLNGRDWTILAWLVSGDGGLGLDAARDNDSRQAMLAALPKLLRQNREFLQGKRLDRDFFNSLLTGGDSARDLLQWLDNEELFRAGKEENEWRAFVDLCKSRFAFDPETAGPLSAAAKLALHEGPWQAIWERYREVWRHFPNIEAQIRKCAPPSDRLGWFLAEENSGWPQWNDEQEAQLRKELARLDNVAPHECPAKLRELEGRHAQRRDSLWAEIGEAPLAMALKELADMAQNMDASPPAGSINELAARYAATGWKADAAALQAVAACAKPQDREIVQKILRNVYLDWLEKSSRHLQALCESGHYPDKSCVSDWHEGDCLLFVDGLRMDCAKSLASLLRAKGLKALEEAYWAALPSLTATGKPAVSPVCGQFVGKEEYTDFEPQIAASGKPLKGNFEKLLVDDGWEILKNGAVGTGKGRAWAEYGALDAQGHHNAARLAQSLPGLLKEIASYIASLLAAGWKRVITLTDHGWLWLPEGLPKISLPADLVENKWGRCAIPKEGSIISIHKMPWRWNRNCYFALADGAGCFRAGQEYAHGGLSLQECLLIQIVVEAADQGDLARIGEIKWNGMRCKISASGSFAALLADMRLKPGDAASSVAAAKKLLKADGSASLAVNDDEEGREAYALLLDGEGKIVARQKTVIGGSANGNG